MKKTKLNKVRKTTLAQLKRQADKLSAQLCKMRGKCEACGSLEGLSWAHMIARSQSSFIRWEPQNWFCLCWKDHYKFTKRPDEWIAWLMSNYPVRYMTWFRIAKTRVEPIRYTFVNETVNRLKACIESNDLLGETHELPISNY